jgi:hypothetical protein
MDPSVNWAKIWRKCIFLLCRKEWASTDGDKTAIIRYPGRPQICLPLSTMDIIHHCLSVVPVPYLAPAFAALRFIWSSVEQARASRQQLQALAQSIAQLLQTLHDQYCAGRLLEAKTSGPLTDLRGFVVLMSIAIKLYTYRSCHRLLDEISSFVQKEATRGFLNLLFTKDQRISQIQEYHQRIGTSVTSFQASHYIFSLRRFFTLTNRTDIRIVEYSSLAIKE